MKQQTPPSSAELMDAGRRLRKRTPRSMLAQLSSASRDPMGVLDRQNSTRLPELVPVRTERMAESAFAFFRGTAALMAADLASSPTSGIEVVSCGDAHVANFGFYASPQRTLVFDLNDFDEAAFAPWEWDVKRLVTSVIVGGRDGGRSDEVINRAARAVIAAYRAALRNSLKRSPLQRYYTHIDAEGGASELDQESRAVLRAAIKAATRRTGERAVSKLTARDADGRLRFLLTPPTTVPMPPDALALLDDMFRQYRRSAAPDVSALLSQYRQVDQVRRVVGVGSVGTRCSLVLLQDGDGNGLILQPKQAARSVLEEYGGYPQREILEKLIDRHGQGARVVALQRILQGVSDQFLGHLTTENFDLYVRQFRDMKGGIDVSELEDRPFVTYAQACGLTLARAHSQSPRVAEVVGYLGNGDGIVEAIVEWAWAYADLSLRDYQQFVSRGR